MNTTPRRKANPGSPEAVNAGCICPVADSARGERGLGQGPNRFWVAAECPLHGINTVTRLERQ